MPQLQIEDSIVDWVTEYPESIAVFEKQGIDYCCGGKSLLYVCAQKGLNPKSILVEIFRNSQQNISD